MNGTHFGNTSLVVGAKVDLDDIIEPRNNITLEYWGDAFPAGGCRHVLDVDVMIDCLGDLHYTSNPVHSLLWRVIARVAFEARRIFSALAHWVVPGASDVSYLTLNCEWGDKTVSHRFLIDTASFRALFPRSNPSGYENAECTLSRGGWFFGQTVTFTPSRPLAHDPAEELEVGGGEYENFN